MTCSLKEHPFIEKRGKDASGERLVLTGIFNHF